VAIDFSAKMIDRAKHIGNAGVKLQVADAEEIFRLKQIISTQ
jgi:hypothetical protein